MLTGPAPKFHPTGDILHPAKPMWEKPFATSRPPQLTRRAKLSAASRRAVPIFGSKAGADADAPIEKIELPLAMVVG